MTLNIIGPIVHYFPKAIRHVNFLSYIFILKEPIRSKNENYPVGSVIVSNHGWILRGNINPKTEFPHAISKFEVIDSKGM